MSKSKFVSEVYIEELNFTMEQKAIVLMLNRLFWVASGAHGAARNPYDVELFTRIGVQAGVVSPEDGARIIKDYKR